mgnify:CR=1 FL=1
MMDNSKARIQEGKRGRGAKKRTKQKGVQERFNVAVKGPSLIKEVGEDKASRGESDWRDVRALLIYQEKDVAQCSKGRRQILGRRVLAHVGTQEQWLKLLHLAFHEYLAEGKVSNVLQRLQNLRRGKKGELAEKLDRCIKYLTEHRQRMHYRKYRDAGMTIGSGAIESVHKWVVQARCHLAGMAWSEAGLNAMLRLRCQWASGAWDDEFRARAPTSDDLPKNSVTAAAA